MPGKALLPGLFLVPFLLHSITAQPSPQPPPTFPAAARDFLDAHNRARSEVNVPPLQWSSYLANLTSLLVRRQRDVRGCQFADLSAFKYAGNQEISYGSVESLLSPRAVVEDWVKQKIYYNYKNNACVQGHSTCGVYTQVVWGKSKLLGCAQAACPKEVSGLTVCFYDPPGNIEGERPY